MGEPSPDKLKLESSFEDDVEVQSQIVSLSPPSSTPHFKTQANLQAMQATNQFQKRVVGKVPPQTT